MKLRQNRIIQVCGLRSKIFRQVVQINQGKADALPRFFGQADGIIFKQAVRLELCGVALAFRELTVIQLGVKAALFEQLVVPALLDDIAVAHNQNNVAVLYC